MVYEDHLNFSAKISVNRPWRIKDRYPPTSSQSRAGSDLTFRSERQRHAKPGRDHGVLAGGQHHRGVAGDSGQEIEPGRELALVGRQRQIGRVREPLYLDVDLLHA
jgi:hypothetical protein